MNRMIRAIDNKGHIYGGRAINLRKSTRVSFAIIVACIACYSPTLILSLSMLCMTDSLWARSHIAPWTELAAMLNSLLNPVIYCLRLKAVRVEIVTLLSACYEKCPKLGKQQQMISPCTLEDLTLEKAKP